jgi:type I restriction enzyme M protein
VGIKRISETFKAWKEDEKFSRIVGKDEIVKNDYNISPSRYIHTADGEEYRPLVEIVDELNTLEEEILKTNSTLQSILQKLGL